VPCTTVVEYLGLIGTSLRQLIRVSGQVVTFDTA